MGVAQFNAVKQQMEKLLNHLEPLLPFINCHMVDYFTKKLFNRYISNAIQKELNVIGHKKAVDLILNDEIDNSTPELKQFVSNMKNLMLYNCKDICLNTEQLCEKLKQMGCMDISTFKLKVFMTPKKAHEVEVLSAIAAAVKHIGKTTHVVDIGDGKGYLSSMLALHHKIPVLGIDASKNNTHGAGERVEKLQRAWNGIRRRFEECDFPTSDLEVHSSLLYKQVTQFIKEDADVKQLIRDIFLKDSTGISLTGLHTCGDLSPTSIKIFDFNESVKTICNVGCCYHLITERFGDKNLTNAGFPMSDFLVSRKFHLGRNSRMLAAQSLDRILAKKERFKKIILYRAVLEILLKRYNYCLEETVGKTKKPCSSFLEYVKVAVKKLNVDIPLSDHEISEFYSSYEEKEDELNLFNLFRCLVAPAIECLILLDRLLFLLERGYENSYLVKLFDPVVSPRCYGLVSLKLT